MAVNREFSVDYGPAYTGLASTLTYTITGADGTLIVANTNLNVAEHPANPGSYLMNYPLDPSVGGRIDYNLPAWPNAPYYDIFQPIFVPAVGQVVLPAPPRPTSGLAQSVAPGDTWRPVVTIAGLASPLMTARLLVKANVSDNVGGGIAAVIDRPLVTIANVANLGQILNAGAIQPDGTYTATVRFEVNGSATTSPATAAGTGALTAGKNYWWSVIVNDSTGYVTTPVVAAPLAALSGGLNG